MSRTQAPDPDQLEISIIGPGRGETIVIHLGQNQWAVVDSCIAKGSSAPAAIEYLSGFGADALAGIKLVLATHWHDDHIKGLSRILTDAPDACFACSVALGADEFLSLVGLATESIGGLEGVRELEDILSQLGTRKAAGQPSRLFSPQYAIEGRPLLTLSAAGRPFPVTIRALSPSDVTVTLAKQEIALLIPRAGVPVPSIISPANPNHSSVVLWVEAGNQRVLLGADLEHINQPGRGWSAVVQGHLDPVLAGIVKVPHHGSPGADSPDMWDKLLSPTTVALVAPYNGGRWLPSPSDEARIAKRTPNAYCTAEKPGAPPRREGFIEKEIKRTAKLRRVVGQAGHVRIRWRVAQNGALPTVELFNGAYKLEAPAA